MDSIWYDTAEPMQYYYKGLNIAVVELFIYINYFIKFIFLSSDLQKESVGLTIEITVHGIC